jgi:predicted TIM-barrel fold metal-dependent hydrolase
LIPELPAIKTAVTTMDALGIAGLVIDEVYKGRLDRHGYPLPNGATRVNHDFSKKAVRLFPHRFAYLFHVDPLDSDLEAVMAEASRDPAMVGIRVTPTTYPNGVALWRERGWEGVFRAAEKHHVAAFCMLIGLDGLAGFGEAASRFPDMLFVLDHTGMAGSLSREGGTTEQFEPVAQLARHPNIALKWSHAPRLGGPSERYPFPTALAFLQRAIDAFGRERIMWASDCTRARVHHTWAAALTYILAAPQLSTVDKEWILGRTARTLLRWPATADQADTTPWALRA